MPVAGRFQLFRLPVEWVSAANLTPDDEAAARFGCDREECDGRSAYHGFCAILTGS